MAVPPRCSIKIGSSVGIILKRDQPTGKITVGNVKTILTASAFHPRGIKVELVNGLVGRVQYLNKSKNDDALACGNQDVTGCDSVFRAGYKNTSYRHVNSRFDMFTNDMPSEPELDRNNRSLMDFIAPNQRQKIESNGTNANVCYDEGNFNVMRSILTGEFNDKHLITALIRCNNVVDDAVLLCMEQGCEGMELLS